MSNEPICVCGKQMTLRRGSHGAFYGCVDYPRCDHTENADDENDECEDS